MARLPTAEELGALPSALSNRPIATYDVSGYARGAAAMAEGISSLGRGIGKAVDSVAELRQREERNRLDRAKADANTLIATKGLRAALAAESDPDAIASTYSKAFRNTYASASGLIGDPRAREDWTLARGADRDGEIAAAFDHAKTLRKQREVTDVTAQLDALRDSALDDEDEASRAKAIDTGNNLIFGLHGTGAIDEAQAKTLREGWAQNYAEGRLDRLPPEERIATLERSEGNIAEFIPAERRIELIRTARADKLDLDRKAQSDAGLARFVTSEEIAKDLAQIQATGRGRDDLTPQRIDDTLGSEARRAWQAQRDDAFTSRRSARTSPKFVMT